MIDGEEYNIVLNTDDVKFRGCYRTMEEAEKSVAKQRFNTYIIDDPMHLVEFECISLSQLVKLLKQFEADTSERILADRATVIQRLWHHWTDWGFRPFRKDSLRKEKK